MRKESFVSEQTTPIVPAALPLAPSRRSGWPRLPRHIAPLMLVAGLALTLAWLGLVAWGVALLVNAAL